MKVEFVNKIAQILKGNLMARGIGFIMLPILTRLYTPESFGALNIFVSSISLIAIIATMNLPQCILLERNLFGVRNLIKLMSISSLLTFLIMLILSFILYFSGVYSEYRTLSIILAIACIIYSYFEIITNLILKSKNYLEYGYFELKRTTINSLSNTTMFYFFPIYGLVISELISRMVLSIYYITKNYGVLDVENNIEINKIKITDTFSQYKNYCFYGGGSNLLISTAFIFPALIFGHSYGMQALGVFALVQRVIDIPYSLIANATSKVYLAEGIALVQSKQKFLYFYVSFALKLLVVGLFGNLIVGILMLYFSGFIFGNEWDGVKDIVIPLIAMSVIRTVVSPISQTSVILNRQKTEFILSIIRVGLLFIAMAIIRYAEFDFVTAVIIYSFVMIITYLLFFIVYTLFVNQYEKKIS